MSIRTRTATFALAFTLLATAAGADEPRLAEYFGFLPLEIYKFENNRISNLAVADLDGDKVDDVIVVNNSKSHIQFLLSSKGTTEDHPKNEVNQLVQDKRMRLKSLAVNKEIVSLVTGDFNGDGKIDIAYYGTPAELVVHFGKGNSHFEVRRDEKGRITGFDVRVGDLTYSDLDGNGRIDGYTGPG